MMINDINNMAELDAAIARVKAKKDAQQRQLTEGFSDAVSGLTPGNIIKHALFSGKGGSSNEGSGSGISSLLNPMNLLGNLGGAKGSLLSTAASLGLSFLSKKLNKNVSRASSNGVVASSTRNTIAATIATAGVGIITSKLFKGKTNNRTNMMIRNALKTVITTVVLANLDRIIAWATAAFKTKLGKKSPEGV